VQNLQMGQNQMAGWAGDRKTDSQFVWPEEVPWSVLSPDFIQTWGHDDDGKLRAEHLEVYGQSGSGKSYSIATILQQRASAWNSAEVAVLTKQADDSIPLLGWPEVTDFSELRKYRQAIFWPRTGLQGEQREKYHETQIYNLLSSLWRPQANTVLYFDEVAYIEDLSSRLKKMVRMYWREGRSHGISLIASKQRPIGINRDAHSESRWKIAFPPADMGDMRRFAELLGRVPDWQPVFESLDQTMHQFILRNSYTDDAYISWIDTELKPMKSQEDTREHQGMYPKDRSKDK
jgi:hypothetical protein